MPIKHVIFDFNGTLFWDTPYHSQAWDIFLKNHQLSLTDEEKAHRIHGKSNEDIVKLIFDRSLSSESIQEMGMEKELIYQEICLKNKMDFAPGAIDLFRFLKSKNIDFTIATSSGWINIEFYLKHMDLAKWLDPEKIVYNDGSFIGKPNPDIFLIAIERMGALPGQVLIFEDSVTGIMAAESSGVHKIIIVNSTNSNYTHLPYPCIRHFDELDRSLFY
jgi:beta-phosphoglucomutase-like phosphatase (HAD superfamily)